MLSPSDYKRKSIFWEDVEPLELNLPPPVYEHKPRIRKKILALLGWSYNPVRHWRTISLVLLLIVSLTWRGSKGRDIAITTSTSKVDSVSDFWIGSIDRKGFPAFRNSPHTVFRNVVDYGARGDGRSDDTEAIQSAMDEGGRCGPGCGSQTTAPALVYFPPGTYLVSKPIEMRDYTQIIGDANIRPTLRASHGFAGTAVIDAGPRYGASDATPRADRTGFWRQVRNLNIDLTLMPPAAGTGIRWQAARATSLQNIAFRMRTDESERNRQRGLLIEDSSGGFITDLSFDGGRHGVYGGGRHLTARNLTFNNCRAAIKVTWNWVWTLHGLEINHCGIGLDMATGGLGDSAVASVVFLDSAIKNTPIGVLTAFSPYSADTSGTLTVENVDMAMNVPVAVQTTGNTGPVLPGNVIIESFIRGKIHTPSEGKIMVQGLQGRPVKPAALQDMTGRVVARSKPQYEHVPVGRFLSTKAYGCAGDGRTDDTAALQALFNRAGPDDVVYFDHGAYVVSDTVDIPKDVRIVGEAWPLLIAHGAVFEEQANPRPVIRIGRPGDIGMFEMSDMIIQTQGPQPGAILVEFNIAGVRPGAAGLWDVHFRIGGSAGTRLQSDTCAGSQETSAPDPKCMGAYLLTHITPESSGYFENVLWWVADHELDLIDHPVPLTIFNGRGVLCEARAGTWFWGTASEHSVLYNYQFHNATNVYMGHVQTHTAPFQGNPDATMPFSSDEAVLDPDFARPCMFLGDNCARAWGIRAVISEAIFIYGAGLYSLFDNYDSTCVSTNSCQKHIVALDHSDVKIFGLNTKGAETMVTCNGMQAEVADDSRNGYCSTLAFFDPPPLH